MPRHVADHHAGAPAAQPKQIVEISADAFRWHDARRDLRVRRDDVARRQELHLQVVRELHLVREPLLLDRRADEPRVLNRRADLRRDRGHQLLIAGGEWLPRAAVGQIHDAERHPARAAWST